MRTITFSQRHTGSQTWDLRIEADEPVSARRPTAEDQLEARVVKKLLATASHLAFMELCPSPVDVGATIEVFVNQDDDGEFEDNDEFDADGISHYPEPLSITLNRVDGSKREINLKETLPVHNKADEGHDFIELDNGNIHIRVNTDKANQVIGGFGTPSVLAAWATLRMYEQGLKHLESQEMAEMATSPIPPAGFVRGGGEDTW